ncbi:MAG: phosphatidylserine decarboxylase [Campylobacterales bacterium]|nr:phosphatidylserine decarboxylase [Campylobacterales bacterium]
MLSRYFTSVVSRLFGRFASHQFFSLCQCCINKCYVKLMKLDLSEFKDACSYKSLNALFTRAFEIPRSFSKDSKVIIAPVDSLVTYYGEIKDGKSYQIKGSSYSIIDLLGEKYKEKAKELEFGDFANFYLSPRDYHRYHIPFDLKITSLTHIPGSCMPVNLPFLKRKKNLFIENERIVIESYTLEGKLIFIVLIAALNVGKMKIVFDKRVQTNSKADAISYYEYSDIVLQKGELLGWFEMGSTFLVFSEKETLNYDMNVMKHVKFGDTIGKLN